MINGESVMAVIPARAGSKRVRDKNLRGYEGTWIVERAFNAARASRYIDKVVLSSDSHAILQRGLDLGMMVLERPAWLADDRATCEAVLLNVLYTWQWADWIVLLQPTSPLRTTEDIDTCIERATMGTGCITYNEKGARNGAVYVTRSKHLASRVEFSKDTFDQHLIMADTRSVDLDYIQDFQ